MQDKDIIPIMPKLTAEQISAMFQIDLSGCDTESRDKELDARSEQKELQQKKEHLERCGIGEKYLEDRFEKFDAYNDSLKHNLEMAKEFVSDLEKGLTRSLWICGKNGNGKTMLAACILYELGYGIYRKSYEIEDELEETMSFSSKQKKSNIINYYSKVDFLVIDEIARFSSQKELGYLFRILNERYERELPTILISNLDKKALKEYLGQALFDRFSEICTSICFNEESYRIKKRKII